MEERRKNEQEEISTQVQSAIAPFASMINDLRNELREIKVELQNMRKENQEFKDLITGARFLASTGKAVLVVGAIIGMLWAAFLVITKRV